MANPTDHLKNVDRASMTLALPYGKHVFQGRLYMSTNTGSASPNHQIKLRQALCEGVIDSIDAVWYAGTKIDAANYTLYDGSQTAAPPAPFEKDFAHFGTAVLQLTLPVGMGEADVKENPPDKAEMIGKCLKVKDYNSSGTPTAASYSASPARVVADLLHHRAGESLDRMNWTRWTAWRDHLATTETVNYTSLTNFDGIGLRGYYYSDTTFTTQVDTRIDPSIFFETSSGSPSYKLTSADNFSVRWLGKIRAKGTGTYTFSVNGDETVKIFVQDMGTPIVNLTAPGAASGTITLTANQLYDIKIEWTEATGNAQCVVTWTPPTEVAHNIPQEHLYPEAVSQPRFEAHALFETPTDLDTAVRQVLAMSNSVMQMADGKRRFYCVDELTPVMDVTAAHIKDGTLKWYRRDRRELRNHWEALFRDLESQYIEVAQPPITREFPELQDAKGMVISGQALDLDNMTHWQAYKVLQYVTKRDVEMDLFCEFDGLATTYKLLPGDLITIDHTQPGWNEKQFMVIEATDYSAEDTPDRRNFVCMEWT